jgi:hypothetical protein
MPISHITKVFAVTDCKIALLTADVAGGSATYGTSLDVPGIKSVTITGDVETKQLRGDNTLLDSDSVITGISVSIEYAKLSLDVIALLFGATVVDSGTTPNQLATLDLSGTIKPRPFRLEAISASADPVAGAVRFTLHKVIVSSFPELGLAEEDYKTGTLEGSAMPLLATGNKWISTIIQETAAVLP